MSFRSRRELWTARVGIDGIVVWLGEFDDERDAASAYDEAAFELWGEFARLNMAWA